MNEKGCRKGCSVGKYCLQSDIGPPCFVLSSLASASSGEQGERVPWSFRQDGLGNARTVNTRTIISRQRRICSCLDIVCRKVIDSSALFQGQNMLFLLGIPIDLQVKISIDLFACEYRYVSELTDVEAVRVCKCMQLLQPVSISIKCDVLTFYDADVIDLKL